MWDVTPNIVQHSSGNGSPLAAEANPDKFKVISHDVAISQSILGSDYGEWIYDIKNALINRGPVVEAFVGQELLCNSDPNSRKKINYWVREKKSSLAEVDYLEVVNEKVIPQLSKKT